MNAIDNYEEVVTSLTDSLQKARKANETMSQTVALLQTVSVDDLNAQAIPAIGQSQDMLQLAQTWNSTPSGWCANTSDCLILALKHLFIWFCGNKFTNLPFYM